MEESEDNMSSEDMKDMDSPAVKNKPKKRSLVERELETNLTERITSPLVSDSPNTSRYGRARRSKTESETNDTQKVSKSLKSPQNDKSAIKSPVYKMHASNSPIRVESPTKIAIESTIDHQIENIYNENISLSRFGNEKKYMSPIKDKVYIRKDLIQSKEKDEEITLIKNMFSPVKSSKKSNNHLSNVLERSAEKFSLNTRTNGYLGNSSVVKTLDFDSKKKKGNDSKVLSKSDLFELEAKCEYQVGDLAWAKMGTYPFWPCIVTRDPYSGMFVKKKLFGRVDRDMIHVTFFGDNGRRSWIVDNMLRIFRGQLEFEAAKVKFTPEARKKDPRCAAFFVSEKKLPQWTVSVEEAESLLKEPKRLRMDLLNDMLNKARAGKTTPKGSRKVSRTDSDVSLSESLYDTLFSEDDTKTNETVPKINARKKSLDVSDVVTACLDNMAAKTGITKIQKQSHMDRWLQKAKSKTPEKSQRKSQKMNQPIVIRKKSSRKKETDAKKPFRSATSDNESLSEAENKLQAYQNEHDYSSQGSLENGMVNTESPAGSHGFGVIAKVECLSVGDNDVSSNLLDSELVLSDECVIGEETVVESEDIVMDSNGMNDVMISEVKTIQDDAVSIITISSTLSKNDGGQMDDDYEVSVSGSENQIKSKLNDEDNAGNNIASLKVDSNNGIFSDSDKCNTDRSGTDEAILGVNYLEEAENTDSTNELVNHLTNGHDTETNSEEDLFKNYKKAKAPNEEMPENNMDWSPKTNIMSEGDQEKQDVNIAKTILNDKLVGNTVDSNKTGFINEVNEMSIDETLTVNDDSDLTISETNGHNRSISDDAIHNDVETESSMNKDKFYLEMTENNNSTDSSQYNVNAKTVYNTCSDVYYRENFQTDSSKADETEVLSNGFTYNSTELTEIESIRRNSDSSSFFGDDERSTNSTPNSLKDFSAVNKSKNKLKLIRRVHTRFRNSQNVCDNIEQLTDESPDPENVHNTLNDDLVIPNGEIALDSGSQEQTSLDSSTQESEHCSVESKETSDSDNKSVNDKDEQTESTETTGTVDDDDSTTDSIIQNGYHDPSKEDFTGRDSNTISHVDLSKEKAIMNGDELRLTPNGFQIIKENIQEYTEMTEHKAQDAKASDTASSSSMDSEESMATDVITQNSHLEPRESDMDFETKKSLLNVELNKDEAIMKGDELTLTENGLEINNEICDKNAEINNDDDTEKDVEIISVKIENKEPDAVSIVSTDSEVSLSKRRMRWRVEKQSVAERKTATAKNLEDPEFLKYLELKQDDIIDEHPEFTQDEITTYLYNTWLYEQSLKTDTKKIDDMESANMVKGLQSEPVQKEARKRVKVKKEKDYEPIKEEAVIPKQKPKRRTVRPSYNEEYSDIESDLEVFTIFKPKRKEIQVKTEEASGSAEGVEASEVIEVFEEEEIDEVEEYFARLAEPKPNVFKGLLRERVCEICEKTGNLVKCKGCSCMFHVNCVNKKTEIVEVQAPLKGRKKKKKYKSRKSKSDENLDDSIEDANVSEELANSSLDAIEQESHIVANVDDFESKLEAKMKELLGDTEIQYESPSSGDELDWSDTEPGKCEVIDIKLRKKSEESTDYSDFKCNNCQLYDVPICFVCRSAESPKNNALHRQRCQVAQCNKYYHLECLEHWPQTQFNSGECARYNKKINEYFEALTCPRHVCHTCVSDDPRGCKTRFSGDKLAKCVRCPATYHSFTRCLPAGSQILTGSHIICPRHHEHRPGKVPCHVNTGWCFICALGGTLICCEYCPTSFHAECLNIKPPEGSYMCEDCETGRLPLYGEMVWVKLGHYRWWPAIILHPSEVPENILAVKHSPGEFVVRFFGQYDHYWVNRGRVFPFQEGDSGKLSSQKSKIDAAFQMAMEHASRACEILKSAPENEEESADIASSLLPPHYVKLRANKPSGALCGRRAEPQEGSLTQCECDPADALPCGPYSHCLNRMLLTECGPTCRAGDRCNNRAFEKRQYPKLVPYRAPHRGWGLKTLEDIRAGQFVIEYVGELIDEEEFQRRMRRKHEIRDENFYFLTLDKERMIDAGPKGNLARFMNHCCEPNCETQKWTVLGDVRVGLFALYDIPANSEVTFNYNLESAGIEKKRCLCGAKRCSGYIGAKPKQLQPDQSKKVKVAAKKTYKKRKVEDSPSTSKAKPKPKLGRPPKPKELTDIEKDVLIIKCATNGVASDSECTVRLTSIDKEVKALKRKQIDFSEEPSGSPSKKKVKVSEETCTDSVISACVQ